MKASIFALAALVAGTNAFGGFGGSPHSCDIHGSSPRHWPKGLITAVSKSSPDKVLSHPTEGTITPEISNIVNIPITDTKPHQRCTLYWLYSNKNGGNTGTISLDRLSAPTNLNTTYNNKPKVSVSYGNFQVNRQGSSLLDGFNCINGQTITVEVSAVNQTRLTQFQNNQDAGLVVISCDIE